MEKILGSVLLGNNFKSYILGDNTKILKNLSKINIFVGANNSGKSRFLRQLSVSADEAFCFLGFSQKGVNKFVEDFKAEVHTIMSQFGIADFNGVLAVTENLDLFPDFFKAGEKYFERLDEVKVSIANSSQRYVIAPNHPNGHRMNNPDAINALRLSLMEAHTNLVTKIHQNTPWKGSMPTVFKRVYIPTLRGFRPLVVNSTDLYADRTRTDYFSNASRTPDIFTGYSFYTELQTLLLGKLDGRVTVKSFEKFLSQTFFQGKEVTLIPYLPTEEHPNRKEVYINIDGEEKAVYDLGDGIQQIILLTFLCYKYADEPVLFFIEEPELFLHPGMQRVLLECFGSFKNHQFFFASHSNHFLDITLDQKSISVFSFSKERSKDGAEPVFSILNLSSGHDNALKLLGVKNSSVFLSNCTIWVEGLTDRLYYRHYFDLYQKQLSSSSPKFIEDLHYAFVEYGGSNITHWSFLETASTDPKMNAERLCGKLFLITDKDGESKSERKARLKKFLKERYYCLKRREVENLLTKRSLLAVLSEYKEVSFKEFDEVDYIEVPLGKFIDEKVIKGRRRKALYGEKSGTIRDKDVFCRKALKTITDFDQLSDEVKDLTKRMYKFIMLNNDR